MALRDIDWDADVSVFAGWLSDSLKYGQMGDEVAALWFNVPEVDCGVTSSYVVGCSYFDPKDEDWASDVIWTQEREAADSRQTPGSHPIEFEPPAMNAARGKLGLEDENDEQNLDEEVMIYIGLVLVYFAALIHNVLPVLDRKLALGGRKWRGVGYGFISGELEVAGVLTAEGLVKPGKVHKSLPPNA